MNDYDNNNDNNKNNNKWLLLSIYHVSGTMLGSLHALSYLIQSSKGVGSYITPFYK